MRRNQLIYSALFLFTAFVLATSVSCKKDEDDSPQTKTDQITGKNFVVTAMLISPAVEYNGIEISDFYSIMPSCTKDDITIFNTNGTATFDEGATKCDAGDPQTTSGTWAFLENETRLSVTSDGETEVYNIVELSESKLKISFEIVEDFGNGDETYTYTVTFTAN
ncbi:MAG: lipocalin family protein [Bacteroidales bacterium]|nr:lipocalin family protein [Bacteroidales bacterium]